jgi:pimeloyl-ACP methyl ester carboxylesterase
MATPEQLPTGAELRVTNRGRDRVVVCVNGGREHDVPGTWSASVEWLVTELAPVFPELTFGEVRYRTKSWHRLGSCVEDARAAVQALGAGRTAFLGFSMGGAVAIAAADEPSVERIVGLAPWIPDDLELATLAGRRLDVVHGSLDRSLPRIPGVTPASSRRGFARAQALGVPGSYTLIRGAVHAVALYAPTGRPVPLPRARTWRRLVGERLAAFARP